MTDSQTVAALAARVIIFDWSIGKAMRVIVFIYSVERTPFNARVGDFYR